MPIEFEIAPDRTRFAISKRVDGKFVDKDRFDAGSKKARSAIVASFGISDELLLELTEEARVKAGPVSRLVSAPPPLAAGVISFTIRELPREGSVPGPSKTVESEPFAFLTDHLSSVPVTHVVEWDGTASCCCLDIDYHDIPAPPPDALEAIVYTRLTPRPAAWHLSREGRSGAGLHLFYAASGVYTADELAAVAALRYRALDPVAGLELKRCVRGPGISKTHIAPAPDTGGAVLSDWLSGTDTPDEARDQWLASEGMECGCRYDHSKCPICPTPDEPGAKRDPVCVNDTGVFCFVCEGKGRALGSRRPGFAPWAAILGAPSAGELGHMVRNVAHWGHARYLFSERYAIPELFAKKAYVAALKAYHDGKPTAALVPGIFNTNLDKLARVGPNWMSVADNYTFPSDIRDLIGQMPATQRVLADGSVKTDSGAVTLLNQGVDLTDRGYPALECIHGFKIAAQFLGQNTQRIQIACPNPGLLRRGSPRYLPRYILAKERMPEAEAWAILEEIFPRLDRPLIKLAICAFGSSQETRSGLLPIVFVTGPTGAAKSTTLRIAAAIFGSRLGETYFSPDQDKFRQQIFEGGQNGPAVVCNEILKTAAGGIRQLTPKEALDPLLNLTPDTMYRGLYKDPRPFGRIPAIFLTETNCPSVIKGESQLARRIRHRRLYGEKREWNRTIAAARLMDSDLLLVRTSGDRTTAACNALLSYVCDEFFSVAMSWDEQAEALGAFTIRDSADFDDVVDEQKAFFRAVCEAPPLAERLSKRFGPGYKLITRTGHSGDAPEILELYETFADGVSNKEFVKARRLQEKDWGAVLGIPDVEVNCNLRDDGVNVYVRFSVGPAKCPTLYNEQIIKPEDVK